VAKGAEIVGSSDDHWDHRLQRPSLLQLKRSRPLHQPAEASSRYSKTRRVTINFKQGALAVKRLVAHI
jgi:hypothetical protein